MTKLRTIEQRRSEFAYKCVETVKTESFAGKYKGFVKKFPMMVLKNGLLQSVVFIEAKGKIGIKKDEKGLKDREKNFRKFYDQIREYLSEISPLNLKLPANEMLLSDHLSNLEINKYRNLTTDILAFAKWLARYAEALIEKEEESE